MSTSIHAEREAVPASLQLVSSSFFSVLGVTPALGKLLPEAPDGRDTYEPVAVVSYAYWQRRFGGSPDAVGSPLVINGASFTIVGIAPREFGGVWLETPVDIWAPLTAQPIVQYTQSFTADGADFSRPWLPQPQIWWLHVIARVPPGEVSTVATLFSAEFLPLHRARRRLNSCGSRCSGIASTVRDAARRHDGNGGNYSSHCLRKRGEPVARPRRGSAA